MILPPLSDLSFYLYTRYSFLYQFLLDSLSQLLSAHQDFEMPNDQFSFVINLYAPGNTYLLICFMI